jgi:hypothetical protein
MGHERFTISDETTRRADALEEHLCEAASEFGDSAVILGRVTTILELCLGVVAEATGKRDADEFDTLAPERRARLVLDPVNRRLIQDGFEAVCRNETPDAALADIGLGSDVSPGSLRPTANGLRVYDPSSHPADDPLGAHIRDVLATQATGQDGRAVAIADTGEFEAAEALLATIVPRLWESARRHIRIVVAVGNAPFKSGSDRRLPGAVFVAAAVLRHPELLSEALLHEGIHQKLYDIYLQAPVLETAYDADSSPRLRAPWHGDSDEAPNWPVDNVLAAMHVYAHLAVFRARQGLESQHESGPPYASALSRAVYLAEAARSGRAGRLGPSGTAMVEWLWDGLTSYVGQELGSLR